MPTRMEIQEQALLSGLVFADSKDKTEPQWRPSSDNWPPLLERHVSDHGLLVVHHPDTTHDKLVVLLGGWTGRPSDGTTNWVSLLDFCKKRWQNGPPLQEKRRSLASVVCNGAVYAIGGYNGQIVLDTIERIPVSDLLHSSSSSKSSSKGWKMLKCRLTSKRYSCAALTVSDRFIVVAGGCISHVHKELSSVDILDTAFGNPCSVVSGPSLQECRRHFAMAVVGSRIYAVGGLGTVSCRESVECLEFDDWLDPVTSTVALSTKSWTIDKELSLNIPRAGFFAVQVGSCIVVAGGWGVRGLGVCAVEVVDTVRNTTWVLPDVTISWVRGVCGIMPLPNTLVVITRNDRMEFWCETLSLLDQKSWLFARLLDIGKVPKSPGSFFGSSSTRSSLCFPLDPL